MESWKSDRSSGDYGTGLIPASAFLIIPVLLPDWPDAGSTAFWLLKNKKVKKMHTPCTSILQLMDWETPYTFILLVVERGTHARPCWWLWKGIHPARPYCWWWKWIHHASPYWRRWKWIHPARLYCWLLKWIHTAYSWRWKGIHSALPYCWWWKGPCTSILLAVVRDTPCMCILLEGYTLHVHTAGGGKGYTLHVHTAGCGNVYSKIQRMPAWNSPKGNDPYVSKHS